jgi:hypothetical protein
MSWAGIAANQCVSRNNLQDAVTTGVFTLKNTIPAGTKQITKNEAEYYVNLNTAYSPFAAKSNNQLVVKSNLQACTNLPYSYTLYYFYDDGDPTMWIAGFSNTTDACDAVSESLTVYSSSSSIVIGTYLYVDSCGNIPLTALTSGETYKYYKIGTNYITFGNYDGMTDAIDSIGACSVTAYSYNVRLDETSISNVCFQPFTTIYSSNPEFTEGITLYFDSGLTSVVTGYMYVSFLGTSEIFDLNIGTGVVLANTGLNC